MALSFQKTELLFGWNENVFASKTGALILFLGAEVIGLFWGWSKLSSTALQQGSPYWPFLGQCMKVIDSDLNMSAWLTVMYKLKNRIYRSLMNRQGFSFGGVREDHKRMQLFLKRGVKEIHSLSSPIWSTALPNDRWLLSKCLESRIRGKINEEYKMQYRKSLLSFVTRDLLIVESTFCKHDRTSTY